MEAINRLIDYKLKALERVQNPAARRAIEYEIRQLHSIADRVEEQQRTIDTLYNEIDELHEQKAIAEGVCLAHGIPAKIIEMYYNVKGLSGTMAELEQMQEHNQLIVPFKLRHLKKYD